MPGADELADAVQAMGAPVFGKDERSPGRQTSLVQSAHAPSAILKRPSGEDGSGRQRFHLCSHVVRLRGTLLSNSRTTCLLGCPASMRNRGRSFRSFA
jgi:hypothetical protein